MIAAEHFAQNRKERCTRSGAAAGKAGLQRKEPVRERADGGCNSAGSIWIHLLLQFRGHAQAARRSQRERCESSIEQADEQLDFTHECVTDDESRKTHESVAEHTAEAGRQRPTRARRQGGDEAGAQHHAKDPAGETKFQTRCRTMGHDLPAPDCRRQDDGESRETHGLHQEIGGNRAGPTEPVLHGRVGRVIEARILYRPRRQRDGGRRGDRDDGEPADLGETASEHRKDVFGQEDGTCGSSSCAWRSLSKFSVDQP